MSRPLANLLLLLAGAIWGMGFVAQATAMAHLGPWTYTAARFLVAALALLLFALLERRRAGGRPLAPADRRGFLLCGLALFLGSILQQLGLLSTSVTNAGFLTGLYVVFTPFLAVLVLKSRPHPVVLPAALASFLGIALLSGGGVAAPGGGDLLVVLSALAFAAQILLVGILAARSHRPLALSLAQFATVGLLALLGALALESPTLPALRAALPEILYGGLFSIGLAFTLQTVGQRHTTAAQAAIFLSSEALFAALFGALFLGERIAAVGLLGASLMFAAMLAVEIVPILAPRRPAPLPDGREIP